MLCIPNFFAFVCSPVHVQSMLSLHLFSDTCDLLSPPVCSNICCQCFLYLCSHMCGLWFYIFAVICAVYVFCTSLKSYVVLFFSTYLKSYMLSIFLYTFADICVVYVFYTSLQSCMWYIFLTSIQLYVWSMFVYFELYMLSMYARLYKYILVFLSCLTCFLNIEITAFCNSCSVHCGESPTGYEDSTWTSASGTACFIDLWHIEEAVNITSMNITHFEKLKIFKLLKFVYIEDKKLISFIMLFLLNRRNVNCSLSSLLILCLIGLSSWF